MMYNSETLSLNGERDTAIPTVRLGSTHPKVPNKIRPQIQKREFESIWAHIDCAAWSIGHGPCPCSCLTSTKPPLSSRLPFPFHTLRSHLSWIDVILGSVFHSHHFSICIFLYFYISYHSYSYIWSDLDSSDPFYCFGALAKPNTHRTKE